MTLTLGKIPGFVDLPDGLVAAEKFAMGLFFQRILGNAKFGIVRPEVFTGTYKHGDTVPQPISLVDGYTYQRDELIYLWDYRWSGGAGEGTNGNSQAAGPGTIWYFGAFVDQATGDVASWVKYRDSENVNSANMSNDGVLEVFTIGVRRKSSLTVGTTLAAFSDFADAAFATDKAVTQSMIQTLNHNAKCAVLAHECIYMGEYVNGGVVPRPVSPVDGYVYSYAEVTFTWCWRWTTKPAQFVDPGYNQLQRFNAAIDATGNATTAVVYFDDVEWPTTFGRITVVAMCNRRPLAVAQPANLFTDISDENLRSGAFPRYDVFRTLNDAIRFAALRTEFFITEHTHGQTVPLPVSAVDGYAYVRDELAYCYDFKNSGTGQIYPRLQTFGILINQNTGLVTTATNHVKIGGDLRTTADGTVRVLTVARRSHVQPAYPADGLLLDGSGSTEANAALYNGDFELWTQAGSAVADYWRIGTQTGAATLQKDAGLEGASAQGLVVAVGDAASIVSSRVNGKARERKFISLKIKSDVATTRGLYVRVHLYNQDLTNHVYFDLLSDVAMTGAEQQFNMWLELPAILDTTVQSARGTLAITGVYNYVATYCKLELLVSNPNVNVHATLDNVHLDSQLNPSNGQVAQTGVLALAYFPAISIAFTDTTATIHWPTQLDRVDGSITPCVTADTVITGLTQNTQYGLELYWNETNRVLSGIAGGTGSNGWCHTNADLSANARLYAVAWSDQANIPLSKTPIYFTTDVTGGPGGGATGGGDGGCHRLDVKVRELNLGVIEHQFVRKGHRLWTPRGWLLVIEDPVRKPHRTWLHMDTTNNVCDLPMTSGHLMQTSDGRELRAYEMSMDNTFRTPTGRCSPRRLELKEYDSYLVTIRLESPHTYYVSMDGVNWIETHNMMPVGTL